MDQSLFPSRRGCSAKDVPDYRDYYSRFVGRHEHHLTEFIWCIRFESCRNAWTTWIPEASFFYTYVSLPLCANCRRLGYFADVQRWDADNPVFPKLHCNDKKVNIMAENIRLKLL